MELTLPLILGSTTDNVKAAATAASNALPPCEYIVFPASEATGCGDEIILLEYKVSSSLQLIKTNEVNRISTLLFLSIKKRFVEFTNLF